MCPIVFHRVVVRRVVEFVVQSDVLTNGQRLMVRCVMNGFPCDLAGPQIDVMLDMRPLSGMAVGVMIDAEGNS